MELRTATNVVSQRLLLWTGSTGCKRLIDFQDTIAVLLAPFLNDQYDISKHSHLHLWVLFLVFEKCLYQLI